MARLLFQGLWCLADHEGRLHYRPRRIKAEVLPYDDADVASLIAELVAADPADPLIRVYGGTADAPAFLWIPKFREHQCPSRREREKPSTIPACPVDDSTERGDPTPEHDHTAKQPDPVPGSSRDHPGSADIRITDVRITESGCTDGAGAPATAERGSQQSCEVVVERWNTVASECGLVACKALGKKRRAALRERWRDAFWRDHHKEALERLRHIRWVRGETDRRWRADLDWFLRAETVTKLVEGGYDDKTQRIGARRCNSESPF